MSIHAQPPVDHHASLTSVFKSRPQLAAVPKHRHEPTRAIIALVQSQIRLSAIAGDFRQFTVVGQHTSPEIPHNVPDATARVSFETIFGVVSGGFPVGEVANPASGLGDTPDGPGGRGHLSTSP